jgi:predicted GH43/DUF377 family glycosyl hydrolase
MLHDDRRELFQRYAGNPIISGGDLPSIVNTVFNPGAVRFDGETLLLLRVEDRSGLSSFVVGTSSDGLTEWKIQPDRSMIPQTDRFEEHWGIEDPRITQIGENFFIVYTGYSTGGPLICLASTRDFVTFERHGVLMPPEDKDAALFPTRFSGRYALMHRPLPAMAGLGGHVWLSFSPDLRHWGDGRVLIPARRGGWWDANKVGLGPPPLLTDAGWLVCYHGVKNTVSGAVYRLGLALLDRDDPARVLQRGNEWIFGPSTPYELTGDVANVVFPCGWVLADDGETLHMYYGGGDSCVCVASGRLSDLLQHLADHPCPSDHLVHSPGQMPTSDWPPDIIRAVGFDSTSPPDQ